jgi:LuxR family maltose regulon positive regulatory protein
MRKAASAQPLDSGAQSLAERLSRREIDVLRLLANGLSNQEIARQLVIAESTVKMHVKNLYGKLAVHNRVQAVSLAYTLQLI